MPSNPMLNRFKAALTVLFAQRYIAVTYDKNVLQSRISYLCTASDMQRVSRQLIVQSKDIQIDMILDMQSDLDKVCMASFVEQAKMIVAR